ncbi:MAG: deoxyguanosinetriphosphate triphosphohydrolase [Clostridia bacterium]|nr:deoxyguanosinetriphosphate triphosphohydrolase [Clostridia bacterium]
MEKKQIVSPRQRAFETERATLSPYACHAEDSAGRLREEPLCQFRTCFQRDRDRIIYSNSFKRLKGKTQVFFAPDEDHFITRLTHTLDVSQIARSIARTLHLNEDLCEAIALGHDLGHTPFGHVGERVLNSLSSCGFLHNQQSLRVVDVLEEDGKGLNLTQEVRDGILNHKISGTPKTLEAKLVSVADRIAYINHDIEDAIRAGVLKDADLPSGPVKILGGRTRERINTVVADIYENSYGKADIYMSAPVEQAIAELRSFMFERVYELSNKSMQERAMRLLSKLYEYYVAHVDELPARYLLNLEKDGKERVVCDYLSGMTDKYAINLLERLFIPTTFSLGEVTR